MEGQPAVSCICLTYDRPEVLEEAIHSFLLQGYAGRKELIVKNFSGYLYTGQAATWATIKRCFLSKNGHTGVNSVWETSRYSHTGLLTTNSW